VLGVAAAILLASSIPEPEVCWWIDPYYPPAERYQVEVSGSIEPCQVFTPEPDIYCCALPWLVRPASIEVFAILGDVERPSSNGPQVRLDPTCRAFDTNGDQAVGFDELGDALWCVNRPLDTIR